MKRLDISALRFDGLIAREWTVGNGLGGFASSTLAGLNTRKYHGLLVAAMTPPVRRMVILSRVEESVRCDGRSFDLASNEYPGVIHPQGHTYLRAFNHEPFPRWAYQGDGWTIEKQLRLLQGENTVLLTYTLLGGGGPVEVELRPLFALRGMHDLMYQWNGHLESHKLDNAARHLRLPATPRSPEVFFSHDGAFNQQGCWYLNTIYRREQERGYAGLEDLWMPGVVKYALAPGQSVHFVCSTDPIDLIRVLGDAQRQYDAAVAPLIVQRPDPALDGLLRAAEQFVARTRERTPALVSAYPWASPSGRDTMITLPGLLLVPGKIDAARQLLQSFAGLCRDGLMPSELPEDGAGWKYEAADVSLWFVNAVGEFLRYRGDEAVVSRDLLPVVRQIIDHYTRGTALGISTDETGLLRSGVPGLPNSWMDARTGGWVITPRLGRPVSLNALWYNALRTAAELCDRCGQTEAAAAYDRQAARVRDAFNRLYWNGQGQCLFDVLEDGAIDTSIRPDQLFALSLPYPVLDPARHATVLDAVMRELLTPMGLRTLSLADHNYQGSYGGPIVARDRAHHQGSAFPWLLGPLVTAYLRVHGRSDAVRREAAKFLAGCLEYLVDPGTGTVCELFDGDTPHRPGGAPASARSVAEVLRCYVEDVLDINPPRSLPPRASAAELQNSRTEDQIKIK